ncbi:MAG TPA: hypothetical protein VFW05_13230 [Verrucomicrobiae bacterium]|nr:hypothetical protein [Verrucomicrobiae bacterium]
MKAFSKLPDTIMNEFNNRGILFRNFRKTQPKHPDWIGEATIDGRKFKIAGWKKTGRRGEFHSLAFTEAENESSEHAMPAVPVLTAASEENDIPF